MKTGTRPEWAVFNDFCITPIPASEVLQFYGGQKRPCVLIYTQVGCRLRSLANPLLSWLLRLACCLHRASVCTATIKALVDSSHSPIPQTRQEEEAERGDALPHPEPLPPALDAAAFAALCAAPPLQGPNWGGPRTFAPLDMSREAPRPGMLVAIDAEFVAISRAEASLGLERGGQVQLKPSRCAA